ncbi:MAG: hypothetical protein J6S67_19760 [Methanobrevibacter sp.]|nr:hypothetical protein [Methanobrevibacter sp.]
MKVTIFAQKKKTKEGKNFYTYLATLTKKDGDEVKVEAKFREECGAPDPKSCPVIIEVDKSDANISEKKETYTDEVGEEKEVTRRRLWISAYTVSDEKFVDSSLDEFE